MLGSQLKFAVAGLLALPLLTQSAPAADTLRFGGTGSSLGMLRQVGAKFTAATGQKVDVLPSLGSSGAIHALIDGKLDLAVSARPLKPKEAAGGVKHILVLRTPFVLATSDADPRTLKIAELPALFTAAKPVWPDGVAMRLILRPRSETDTRLLGEMAPGMPAAIEKARKRSEIPIAATDQDNLALAQRMPGSLTGTTLTQLTTEPNQLFLIMLDGVKPTLASFESGAYKFTKRLYFIVGDKSAVAPQKFIAFLKSPPGLKALRAAAVLPDVD